MRSIVCCCLLAVVLVPGCGSDDTRASDDAAVDGAGHNPDATTSDSGDASNEADGADGGECCQPDPHPGCCMHYGGWMSSAGSCGMTCDGMPLPGDPAWHLVTDSHGCMVWSSGGSTGPLCGQVLDAGHPLEAGPDAEDAEASVLPDGGVCVANGATCNAAGDCCSGNCILRTTPGYCCVAGGCP
jgi:hypothetical protein